jgi:ubiquinone/menaquinone biosynthesis C-methylase UbiE
MGINNKKIIDIGIGLPSDSDFYKFYIKSGSFLTAFDPDSRLDKTTYLSSKCKIIRKSAEKMDIPSATIDVVVCISSFEHFPVKSFKKTIKEIHRVIKRKGHLIVTLDLTFNKLQSARWAVLEKTISGLPAAENNLKIRPEHQQLTLEYFLKIVSPYFTVKNNIIKNNKAKISELVYSKKWNSYVAYLHLHKQL